MKPIELTLQGLNSFRNRQRIDFEQLCADGIFGIFGPTGSGKSTILDAMTLALYGTVERASNHTQGILNQLEDQLSVSFTFELNGDTVERYRAERAYKRTKEGGLRMSSCRLFQIGPDGSRTVLADKERDVTGKIQEILGLTHDDFTRAVVLPQGKFSEFLKLRGIERRQMLQRIFHLEQYGDVLTLRLRNHAASVQQRLAVIAEKEAVLGDASSEHVRALREESIKIHHKLTETGKQLDLEEKRQEEIRNIFDLQNELAMKKRQLQTLIREKSAIEEEKKRLTKSDAAEKIIPYLETLEASEREQADSEQEMKNASARLEAARTAEQTEKKAFIQARKALETREPLLIEKKKVLIQGISVKKQFDQAKKDAETASEKIRVLSERVSRLNELSEEEARKRDRLTSMIRQLEQRLQEHTVTSALRQQVSQAQNAKKDVDSLRTQIDEKRIKWKMKEKDHQSLRMQADQQQTTLKRLTEKGKEWFAHCMHVYNRLSDLSSKIKILKNDFLAKKEEAVHEKDEAYRQTLAHNLAGGLQEGAPCPVCGALHHPAPAVAADSRKGPSDQMIQSWQDAANTLMQQDQDIRILLANLEQAVKTASALLPGMRTDSVQSEKLTGADQWPEERIRKDAPVETLMGETEASVRAGRQDVLEITERLDHLKTRVQTLLQEGAATASSLNFVEKEQKDIARSAEKLKEKMKQIQKNWPADWPSGDQLKQIADKIRESDSQSENIQNQLGSLRGKYNRTIDQLQDLQQQKAKQEAEWNGLKGTADARRHTAAQCKNELRSLGLAEDASIEEDLKATEVLIQKLKADQNACNESWQRALDLFHIEDKRMNGASDHLTRVRASRERAVKVWKEKVSSSEFTSREDVRTALMNERENKRITEKVARYEKETGAVSSSLLTLEQKLSGRSATKEQVEKAQEDCNLLKEKSQALSEQYGACVKELSDVEGKHDLFISLEKERKQRQKSADQLDKLQRVFRGNAFVSFIAKEQLQQVCYAASKRLGQLTRNRYALEVDDAGSFIVRDDGNGGLRRPVSSLSGGETFLTSLSLALSLSEQIQLRGKVPLQFFFLDEGFGTLDPDLLDTVVTALERLHMHRLSIGVISHVPEMRERLPRRLIVEPAQPSGKGSRVHMELL
ncbi:SbcC/MukB-like Walker B domain-containing protein [Sporolactobacillus sp. THM19-2]|uniref:SbcC/MukB-like Walker B domain-containing protein n=1 Tax=Sporolactobacillus sp. THM19-2 TaxID=2511171 RepID=UPI0013EB8914|nr:SMC family ATPase [Sporolactobacillus sp. THM19-2]